MKDKSFLVSTTACAWALVVLVHGKVTEKDAIRLATDLAEILNIPIEIGKEDDGRKTN